MYVKVLVNLKSLGVRRTRQDQAVNCRDLISYRANVSTESPRRSLPRLVRIRSQHTRWTPPYTHPHLALPCPRHTCRARTMCYTMSTSSGSCSRSILSPRPRGSCKPNSNMSEQQVDSLERTSSTAYTFLKIVLYSSPQTRSMPPSNTQGLRFSDVASR